MFVLYFDLNYYKWASTLIESIQIFEPEEKIYIEATNLTKGRLDKLRKMDNVVEVVQREDKFDPDKADLFRSQMVSRRPIILTEAMVKYPDELLFFIMDIDMILIRSLDKLKKLMIECDMAVMKFSTIKVDGRFMAAKPTQEVKQFLEEWRELLWGGKLYHSKDQKTLAKIHNDWARELKFVYVDRSYSDHLFQNESFIWNACTTKFGSKDKGLTVFKEKLDERR